MNIVSINPYNGEKVSEFEKHTEQEVNATVDAVQAVWGNWRGQHMRGVVLLLLNF